MLLSGSTRTGTVALLAFGASLLLLAGCEPNCKRTCKKLLSCEETDTPRVSLEECQASCEDQEVLYEETWDDPELADAFTDYKKCVRAEECDAIADGVCYDDRLYIWGGEEDG